MSKLVLSQMIDRHHGSIININAICPGTIVTPLIKDVVANIPKDNVPMRRFGTPEEVTQLAVFLASDEAQFMSGSIILIDGGYTIPIKLLIHESERSGVGFLA